MRLQPRSRGPIGAGLCAVLCALLLGLAAVPAQANRALLSKEAVKAEETPAGIEGACGVAVAPSGQIYVSDYYHRVVDVFNGSGGYQSQIPAGAEPEGPCGLAVSPSGTLYVNFYHQGVVRMQPGFEAFDPGDATGVAVDFAGRVYVNDRTYVAVYEPSGLPVIFEGQPLKIGLGSVDPLGDAYGLAVSAGKVYVADGSEETIKVYEPAIDPDDPSAVIDGSATPQHGFNSLTDAALAVDPTNGHLLVTDNLRPGFEHPEAVIDEFDAEGVFLGQLATPIIDAEPSGLALSGSGALYATSGNDEGAAVFRFGQYSASPSLAGPSAPSFGEGATSSQARPLAPPSGPADAPVARKPSAATTSEITQRGHLRVSFDGKLAPHALPRQGSAPVKVTVGAKISTTDGKTPPQLRKISIAINRNGHFDPTGIPVCRLDQIQPSTNADALAACRSSLIGEGRFSAKVLLAGQAPFPSNGKVYAFNSRLQGKPAILAHVYGTQPAPASYTLPFVISQAKGTFANVLTASLPAVTSNSGYITGLQMTLGKSFSYQGKRRSYLSAGCPAPKGFPGAAFPFAKASFGFGKQTVTSTLTRDCGVR